ncbi:MAG: ATP-dependent DNA helicase RecG, partial [Proteobacteria bacterium]|nr:ATP-dependent DNA helicase RecG [Pseudomonadota bacterium]
MEQCLKIKQNTTAPIRYLKGVGPKKSLLLTRLGVNTVEDLLFYLPRRYEDRSTFVLIRDIKVGEYHAIKAEILNMSVFRTRKGISVFHLVIGDSSGLIRCVWFNMPFMKKNFEKGQKIAVYGKVEKYDKIQINHPDYEILENDTGSIHMGRIVPIYSLTQDITQRYLRSIAYDAVGKYASCLQETLPIHVRAKRKMVDIHFAIQNIHFPFSFENLEKSYKRLVFEEFFLLQVALALKKHGVKEKKNGVSHKLDTNLFEAFKKIIPFELTEEQIKAIKDIEKDMASEKSMNRLLEGDVGSGKTVVALYAILLTVKNGYQASIMAPTEILARQHYMTMSEILMPLGINIRLLISGIPKDKKAEIKDEIRNGAVDVVIGTHALIQEDVRFKVLGLIVVDEQHKFGVNQRTILRDKGRNPDVLILTATPIPRTLALTVYGDLDITFIKQMPKGRRPITTFWLEEEKREQVYAFIREEVNKDRQVYIVYPRIEKE